MPPWVSEHIGEIALLIYIFYPLLKRWWDRRKERAERQPSKQADEVKPPAATPHTAKPPRAVRQPRAPAPEEQVRKKPTETDFLQAARERVVRLRADTERLLARVDGDPRLVRLRPVLRDDLLQRVGGLERSLGGTPTLSTIIQDMALVEGLEALLAQLAAMARQRTAGRAAILADADAMADACYGPILEFARAQGLNLMTSQPFAIRGDWDLSIVPRFASTRVAPLRIPAGFESEVWQWPAIAHEVAHDFYYSLESIEGDLRTRLSLPSEVAIPMSERELDPGWLRGLFGAWLPEVFADTLGTIMVGPAYVETMRRAFQNPGSPQRTAAIFQDGGVIDEHPPARLRLYMATRVLHHLGHHEEADVVWERWEADHAGGGLYYLPLGGDWVGLSEESLHTVANGMVDVLLQRPWPELDGFQLLAIPGLAYLHAEHAMAQELALALGHGETVDGDPRLIIAAAVLAAGAQPTLHDAILEAALRSIRGVGEAQAVAPTPRPRAHQRSIGGALRRSLRNPNAIQEAVTLSAILGQDPPSKHPYSR
jgi:hypothetical protein